MPTPYPMTFPRMSAASWILAGGMMLTGTGIGLKTAVADEQGGARGDAAARARAEAAALAARAAERDRSLWAAEEEAQRHEAVIVRLWDQLRSAPDPFVVLRDLPFKAIRTGKLGAPEKLENGVTTTRFAPDPAAPEKSIDREAWAGLLLMLKRRGFLIVQSEWHHSRFVPPAPGRPASSEVSFELHLRKPAPPAHAIVAKGTLGLSWSPAGPAAGPQIETVDASAVQLVEREGAEGFERALNIAPEPAQPGGPVELAPVIVYDLDRDGLPEIVLGAINTVLRNRGGFKFGREDLMAGEAALRNAGNVADFDGDGLVDLLGVKPDGGGLLVLGDAGGRFLGEQRVPWEITTGFMSAMTCGDVDGDGDLDVWLTQYRPPYVKGQMPTPFYDANDGYPSYLLINDGTGRFSDGTAAAGLAPKRHRRTYSSSLVDLDEDGDLDLLVVSDFSGLDIHTNDGAGKFTEATGEFVDGRHAFGMSHTFGDFDLDGRPDLYMAGMSSTTARRLEQLGLARGDFPEYTEMRLPMTFGNRLYQRRGRLLVQTALNDNAARAGWTWGCAAGDFDNDGDDDLYVANGHISGASATDYCTRYWRHDIYAGSSEEDFGVAQWLSDEFRPERMRGLNRGGISWNGFEKNRLFMNLGGKDFIDVGFLMGVGFEDDCRAVVAADFDADGRQDLAVVANQWQPGAEIRPKQSLYLLRNQLPEADRTGWIGVHLDRARAAGARTTLELVSGGTRTEVYMTGDSFYAQRPATAHFGLRSRDGDVLSRIRVRWADGSESVVEDPEPGRYHRLGRDG